MSEADSKDNQPGLPTSPLDAPPPSNNAKDSSLSLHASEPDLRNVPPDTTPSVQAPESHELTTTQDLKAVMAEQPSQSYAKRIDPAVLQRLTLPLPSPSPKAFHPLKAVIEIVKAIIVAVTPYTNVTEPKVSQADFPTSLPSELHGIVEAAVAHEDQRTARFDLKASAFLSTSGILIPLIVTLMTVVTARSLKAALLVSVAFSALAGVASFRALQLKVGLKLSLRAAIGDDGLIREDAKLRHTLTLMLVLKMEECVNDHRAKLIRASSIVLATGTMVLCVAAIVLVA